MLNHLQFAILFAVMSVLTPHAMACVCVDLGSTAAQLDGAETVVLGRVVGLAIETKQVGSETIEYTSATVEVDKRWKGSRQERVTVTTCGDQVVFCTCGVRFDLGGTYIVVTERGAQVSSCGLTRSAHPSDDPLVAEIDAHFKK